MQKLFNLEYNNIWILKLFSLEEKFPKPLTPRLYMKLLQHQHDLNKVLIHHKMVIVTK